MGAVKRGIAQSLMGAASSTLRAAAGSAIVDAFEQTFGSVTAEQISAAQSAVPGLGAEPLDYVLQYVLARDWSGRLTANAPPLTLSDMRAAPNLAGLFPSMPVSGSNVITELAAYLSTIPAQVVPGHHLTAAGPVRGTPAMAARDAGRQTVSARPRAL